MMWKGRRESEPTALAPVFPLDSGEGEAFDSKFGEVLCRHAPDAGVVIPDIAHVMVLILCVSNIDVDNGAFETVEGS